MATPPPTSLTAAFVEAPRHITTPFWVDASGISTAARSLVAPLIAGAMRVHGDQAPTLDRQLLAWWIGLSRHDKGLNGFLEELTSIGFLTIYDGGTAKDGRRLQRRDANGHPLPDIYAVRMDPPGTYVGPSNLSEAYESFRLDRDAAYAQHAEKKASGKKSRVVPVPRTQYGYLDTTQDSACTPSAGVQADQPYPLHGGTDLFSQDKPRTPDSGARNHEPYPSHRGTDSSPQDSGRTPTEGVLLEEEREGTPSREFPPSIDETDPSHNDTQEALEQQVRDGIVRRLPWQRRSAVLSIRDEPRLVAAILTAIREHGITLEQAREHAQLKLDHAGRNPIAYVIRAFTPEHLPAPTSGDVLPLPSDASSATQSTGPNSDDTPAWCGVCNDGVETARGNVRLRYRRDDDGRARVMCPCHPHYAVPAAHIPSPEPAGHNAHSPTPVRFVRASARGDDPVELVRQHREAGLLRR